MICHRIGCDNPVKITTKALPSVYCGVICHRQDMKDYGGGGMAGILTPSIDPARIASAEKRALQGDRTAIEWLKLKGIDSVYEKGELVRL